uniref:myoferlin-like n=1 Tax=Nyctereutes procyonoides TaxID=34880 RepID=UPI00244424CB
MLLCTSQYPQEKTHGPKVPAELRVNIWLGLSAVEKKFNSFAEGTFTVFAEMYENQALMFGKWGTSGLVGHHKFSDVIGKIKLKREFFLPPKGWEWEGEWIVDPERSLLTKADAGHMEFTDEVYQNESRYPGGDWKPAEDTYTDANGDKAASPSELTCPPGWEWEDDAWVYDINHAVDEKGWEYRITIPPDTKPKSLVAAEKMYHTHRRRRLVRKRKKDLTQSTASIARAMEELEDREGWEYASLIGWKFHWKQRSSDTFRRRRWRRKMAPSETHGAAAIFKLEGALGADMTEDGDEKSVDKQKYSATTVFGANTPIVSCNFDRVYIYHLRCYIYQARNLVVLDKDSFSDPYAHVSFLHRSKTTEIIHSTLNPTWDQTIIFDEIEIYGEPQTVLQNPPKVIIELFDNDQVGKDEFLGQSMCSPLLKLNSEMDVTPKLLWHPVMNGDKACGDVLVTAELNLRHKDGSNLPILPSQRAPNLYMVPQGIRPVVQLTAIEILAWGLRNMKNYQMASITSPSLIVECGGERVESVVIKNLKKTPNFPSSVLFMKVFLPKEELYMPPLVIKVIDHRQFGRKPVVGQCTIDRLDRFRCDPYAGKEGLVPQLKDPYAHVSFLHRSKTTEIIHSTLNPTWDQTIIFDEIEIYGEPQTVLQNPPKVIIELFDNDQVGKDEFLGQSMCSPLLKLNSEMDVTPKLLWHPVMNGDKACGDVLVTAELNLRHKDGSNLPILPSQRAPNLYMVPQGIRPVVQLTAIEILAWGLRNMKNHQMASITSPSLIVECGGERVESVVIKNLKKTPNFPSSVLFMKV